MKRTVWGYASDPSDEEWFGCCESREAAIAEATTERSKEWEDCWIVQGEYADPSEHVPDFQTVKDCMEEHLADVCCIDGNGFDVAEGASERLTMLLQTWARTNLTARKWCISGSPERVQFPKPAPAAPNGEPAKEST